RLQRAFRALAGKSRLTEENVAAAAEEVRLALLEADVNLNVARHFVERVKGQVLGARVLDQVEPGQQFIKAVYDNLVALLGGERQPIRWNAGGLTVIMLCGLQGCGKTTTAAKLAARFLRDRRRPLLVAADVQRPAAVEQLRILAGQIGVPVYAQPGGEAVAICRQAVEVGRLQGADTLLIDTAGRLHIDEALMSELENIVRAVHPHEVLFICDAMIGQSAVETAAAFKARLPLSGAILTKLDSDARGGVALSLREVAGVPIKFAAAGEKLDALDEFHPERMASRILGMGDIVSLVEKAQRVVDQQEAATLQQRLIENRFTFTDFLKQLGYVRRLGGFKDFLGLLPGLGQIIPDNEIPEREFKRFEAMIQSMTPAEREAPEIIDYSRRRRIARGSGTTINDVNDLLKQFGEMKRMVDKLGRAGLLRGGLEALSRLATGQAPGIGPGSRSIFGSKKAGTKAQRKKEKKKRRR
ncbi:MAG: signal recognition particle protein, partial [Planctomycetota bacterium]|nr:signal recognition particle protein [Planctomycetota bacterium]